ncbi:MAG TPA: GNAT family N-acetyltransferase [Bacteriovoracaceae bacterium]|nr:GNAT family N-acetyltransferase [Bacteriovoracaceae bacterium]
MAKIKIRKARIEDASAIHAAHMDSIKTVCSKDHSPEEISAWGGRSFNHLRWKEAIELHSVWVVELDGAIEGYAHLQVSKGLSELEGYIEGLYLTSKCLGKKVGAALLDLMVEEARKGAVPTLRLHSTLTAHGFYLKAGFSDDAPMTTVTISGQAIRCFPMSRAL